MNPTARDFLDRLDAVELRLGRHIVEEHPGLTRPDPGDTERWQAGQIWAHIAEFIPYWIAEVAKVATATSGAPVPFGRTKRDPARIAAIEANRDLAPAEQWTLIRQEIDRLHDLLERLPDAAWAGAGLHPTLGEMSMARICDEFLVGHLEQHAAQLDSIVAP